MTDAQVEAIDNLTESFMSSGKQTAFDKLFLYIKMMFRKEEEEYREHGHPDLGVHIALHKEFERFLFFFNQKFFIERSKAIDLTETCLYIKNWTVLHNECYDEFMMPYIKINKFIEENHRAVQRP